MPKALTPRSEAARRMLTPSSIPLIVSSSSIRL